MRGLAFSLAFHTLVVLVAALGLPWLSRPPASASHTISVDVVRLSEISRPGMGERPKPKADRPPDAGRDTSKRPVARDRPASPEPPAETARPAPETAPPKPARPKAAAPQPKPVPPKAVAAKPPPPPPPPAPKPKAEPPQTAAIDPRALPPAAPKPPPKAEKKPAAKPVPVPEKEAKPEKEPAKAPPPRIARPEPPRQKPKPEPEPAPTAQPAAPRPAPQIAALPRRRPAARPPARPKPRPVRKRPERPNPLDSVFRTVGEIKQEAQEEADRDRTAPAAPPGREDAPDSRPMTLSEIEAVRRQIQPCWNFPVGARDAGSLRVLIRLWLDRDGSVRRAAVLDRARIDGDAKLRAAADAGLRAVKNPRCSPLRLPADKYDRWKVLTIDFDPSKLRTG